MTYILAILTVFVGVIALALILIWRAILGNSLINYKVSEFLKENTKKLQENTKAISSDGRSFDAYRKAQSDLVGVLGELPSKLRDSFKNNTDARQS